MSKKKKTLADSLNAGREFPPALSTKELVGKVFTIEEIREVHTEFGERNIATIRLNGAGETEDAWLNGAILSRQIEELIADDQLPATVKLATDPSARDAYVFEEPGPGETFDAEVAAHSAD